MADYDKSDVKRGPGIDSGLSKAIGERLSAERWGPIIDRAVRDAQNGEIAARDFLYRAAVACW